VTGGRDPGVVALRVVAIAGVVLGHWLVTAPAVAADGTVRLDSPLRSLPVLAPASWLFQTLGLFFLVAGFGAARSRAATPGSAATWWWRRVRGLVGPVAALTGVTTAVAVGLSLHGAGQDVVRTIVLLSLSPLWFLGVHLTLLAATPLLLRLDDRLGTAATAVPVLLAVAAPLGGGTLAGTAVLTGWWVPWQLGIALARRPLPRPAAVALLAGGVAGVLVLVLVGGLPATAVGVRGAAASNLAPPSAATVCLCLAQAGLAVLGRPVLARAGRWRAVQLADRAALPVFLLHLPLFSALWLGTLRWGPLPGLHDVPDSAAWLLARAGWLVATAALLAGELALRRGAPRSEVRCAGQPARPGPQPGHHPAHHDRRPERAGVVGHQRVVPLHPVTAGHGTTDALDHQEVRAGREPGQHHRAGPDGGTRAQAVHQQAVAVTHRGRHRRPGDAGEHPPGGQPGHGATGTARSVRRDHRE
jgi:hypothetical protein